MCSSSRFKVSRSGIEVQDMECIGVGFRLVVGERTSQVVASEASPGDSGNPLAPTLPTSRRPYHTPPEPCTTLSQPKALPDGAPTTDPAHDFLFTKLLQIWAEGL